MKERPILFSTPMVQAILEDRKTQTRRIMKPQPFLHKQYSSSDPKYKEWFGLNGSHNDSPGKWIQFCPYGSIGDMLWVRETWQKIEGDRFIYKADPIIWGGKWKPSIFMPKEACRIKLLVKNIRSERLQDIMLDENIEDIAAEGIPKSPFMVYTPDEDGGYDKEFDTEEFKDEYRNLWESINGKGSWVKNPWVWVVEFKKLQS